MLHKAPQAFLHFMKIIHPKFGNGDREKEKKKMRQLCEILRIMELSTCSHI